MTEAITREEIINIGRHNATVAAALQLWRNGDCEWSQAMMMAVVHLAGQNESLIVEAAAGRSGRPVIVQFCGNAE